MTKLSKKFSKLIKEGKVNFEYGDNICLIPFLDLNSEDRKYILRRNGNLIKEFFEITFVRKVTKEERMIAIKSQPTSIVYMPRQTKKERDLAISLDPKAITCIKNPTDDDRLIRCFYNPSEKIKNFVLDKQE